LEKPMGRDTIFSIPKTPVPPFEFNVAVADVFDDMIHRSVPMCRDIRRVNIKRAGEASA